MNKKTKLRIAIASIAGVAVIVLGGVYISKGFFNNVSDQSAATVLNCIVAGPGCPGWTGTSSKATSSPVLATAYNAYGCKSEKNSSPISLKVGRNNVSAFPNGERTGLSSVNIEGSFPSGYNLFVEPKGPVFNSSNKGCNTLTDFNDQGTEIVISNAAAPKCGSAANDTSWIGLRKAPSGTEACSSGNLVGTPSKSSKNVTKKVEVKKGSFVNETWEQYNWKWSCSTPAHTISCEAGRFDALSGGSEGCKTNCSSGWINDGSSNNQRIGLFKLSKLAGYWLFDSVMNILIKDDNN